MKKLIAIVVTTVASLTGVLPAIDTNELAPTGTLRAVYIASNLAQGGKRNGEEKKKKTRVASPC